MHLASHLKHPQFIGFDANKAPEKPDLNRFFQKGDSKEGWQGRIMKKDDDFFFYALISLCTCLLTYLSLYFNIVLAKKDGKAERWGSMMTFLPIHLSPYALIFLRTCYFTHSFPYAFVSLRTWLLTVYAIRRYFRLWKLSVFRLLVEEWGYYFSSVIG